MSAIKYCYLEWLIITFGSILCGLKQSYVQWWTVAIWDLIALLIFFKTILIQNTILVWNIQFDYRNISFHIHPIIYFYYRSSYLHFIYFFVSIQSKPIMNMIGHNRSFTSWSIIIVDLVIWLVKMPINVQIKTSINKTSVLSKACKNIFTKFPKILHIYVISNNWENYEWHTKNDGFRKNIPYF